MRFELHLLTGIKKFNTLEEVKTVTKNMHQPYVIYKFVESKSNKAIEEINLFGDDGIEQLMRDVSRGATVNELRKKYHTTPYKIATYIAKYKSEYESIK